MTVAVWFCCCCCCCCCCCSAAGTASIQSCVKPLIYATAVEDNGLKSVHRHVGIEPSGLAFNEVSLNSDNLPHNPMINAGAIATGSCVRPKADMAERFKYFMERLRALAGGEKVWFCSAASGSVLVLSVCLRVCCGVCVSVHIHSLHSLFDDFLHQHPPHFRHCAFSSR